MTKGQADRCKRKATENIPSVPEFHSRTIEVRSIAGGRTMELGICKLCLLEKPLINSHLMARGVHDFCRTPNDDPIFISSKVIMQSGRQLQHPLLCKECDCATES